MRPRFYFGLIAGLAFGFCVPDLAFAQSAGGATATKEAITKKMNVKRRMAAVSAAYQESKEKFELANSDIEKQFGILKSRSVSDIAFEDVFRMLHLQKVELKIALEGLNARLELIKKEAGKSTSDVVESTQRELLQKYLANQGKALARMKTLAADGLTSKAKVSEAEQLLIEAELRLQQFDKKAKQASPAMVRAMFEVALDIAEKNAKLQTVEQMLKGYVESRGDFAKLQQLRGTRDSLSTRIEKLSTELWSLGVESTDF